MVQGSSVGRVTLPGMMAVAIMLSGCTAFHDPGKLELSASVEPFSFAGNTSANLTIRLLNNDTHDLRVLTLRMWKSVSLFVEGSRVCNCLIDHGKNMEKSEIVTLRPGEQVLLRQPINIPNFFPDISKGGNFTARVTYRIDDNAGYEKYWRGELQANATFQTTPDPISPFR